jgi:DNA-binding transcriptional MerR regulator/methylmalonyl-CoA mutase cobalamin-binding subunit
MIQRPIMPATGRYKMGTIARLTGLSPALLRAWERRHGLLEPERSDGGHRLYTDDDLRVLRRVQALLAGGRAIGEVARIGRQGLLDEARSAERGVLREADAGNGSGASATAAPAVVQLRSVLVESARQIDEITFARTLDQAFATFAPDRVVDDVVVPTSRQLGALWADGDLSIAAEHMASAVFVRRLHRLLESASSAHTGLESRAIVACFPGEQHELGSLVLAYHVARRGVRVSYLGPNLPFADLATACSKVRPKAVYLSVTRDAVARAHRPALLEFLRTWGGRFDVHIGGGGLSAADRDIASAGGHVWGQATDVWRYDPRLIPGTNGAG